MSEVCVCGHSKACHGGNKNYLSVEEFLCHKYCEPDTDDPKNGRFSCDCDQYRRALPWPDSAGWWWFECTDKDMPEYRGLHRFFNHPEYGLVAWCDDGDLTGQDDWPLHHGPALFTKLLEPNPFGDKPCPAKLIATKRSPN